MILLQVLMTILVAGRGEAATKALIPVRIDFVEALAPRDTTSSTRYTQSYEGTISTANSLLQTKLAKCGYVLDPKTSFYDASDSLKAKEFGAKAADDGAWMIVGPRRSNHYLLLVQGAESLPTASIMASSDTVGELGSLHVTLSPVNSRLAEIAAKEAKRRTKGGRGYVSIVNSDCSNCQDFAKAFDKAAAKLGLTKIETFEVTGETPDVEAIRAKVMPLKPDFVLLPNYSKVSSSIMAGFNEEKRPPLFVGGDGWGDSQYGFVQNGLDVQKIKGITVRGFPPVEEGLRSFELGRKLSAEKLKNLSFTPDLSILKILDETVNALCDSRPKNKATFAAAFEKRYSKKLLEPWGVSLFELEKGQIRFARAIGK
jgi:hypothetical protein